MDRSDQSETSTSVCGLNKSLTDLENLVVERGDGVSKETEPHGRGVDGGAAPRCTTLARTDPLVI